MSYKVVAFIYEKNVNESQHSVLSSEHFYNRFSMLPIKTINKFLSSSKFKNKLLKTEVLGALNLREAFDMLRNKGYMKNPNCHYYVYESNNGKYTLKTKIIKRNNL